MNFIRRLSSHSGRVERWLGREQCEEMSAAMCGGGGRPKWYGSPIPVPSLPGNVSIDRDGDFIGRIEGGAEASIYDALDAVVRKQSLVRFARATNQLGGFASLAALNGAPKQVLSFSKNGTGIATAAGETLFKATTLPAAGSAGAAAPGGTAHVSSDAGAFVVKNADTGKSLHLVDFRLSLSAAAPRSVLLYDRLFSVAKTMNSTATEAVTGVPLRYQSTTQGAGDSAENNFLFLEVNTALAATAHNWTVCQYTDQSGNAAANLPSVSGISGALANRLDMPVNTWFCPLATGDTGIKALTQMQCSALVATGTLDFVIGHPIGWGVSFVDSYIFTNAGINAMFQMNRVYDNACLSLLSVMQGATACVMRGMIVLAEG